MLSETTDTTKKLAQLEQIQINFIRDLDIEIERTKRELGGLESDRADALTLLASVRKRKREIAE